MEDARPICQMYWLRDVVTGLVERLGQNADVEEKTEDMCQLEIVNLQNMWNIHRLGDGNEDDPMPEVCRWEHPEHGAMPFSGQ